MIKLSDNNNNKIGVTMKRNEILEKRNKYKMALIWLLIIMGNESCKNQLIYEEREKTKSIFLDSSSIEIRSFLVSQTFWTSKFKCTVYNVDIVSFCWFRLYIYWLFYTFSIAAVIYHMNVLKCTCNCIPFVSFNEVLTTYGCYFVSVI